MPLSTDSMNQEQLLDKLKVFKIQGRDKRGHIILRILAKFFPGIYTQFLIFTCNCTICFSDNLCFLISCSIKHLILTFLRFSYQRACRDVYHFSVLMNCFMLWFYLARDVSVDGVNKYLEEKIFPELEKRSFSVLYVHTDVEKSLNFPGISALRSFHDAIPANVIKNLHAVYFLHPGLQSRLFLATFGRFMFTSG